MCFLADGQTLYARLEPNTTYWTSFDDWGNHVTAISDSTGLVTINFGVSLREMIYLGSGLSVGIAIYRDSYDGTLISYVPEESIPTCYW